MSWFLHKVWRNVAFNHLLTNGCSAVNGCRHKSPNSWWRHHNNSHPSSPQVNILKNPKTVRISDGTHSLQRIQWWASDGITSNQGISSNLMTKLINGSRISTSIFGWTTPSLCKFTINSSMRASLYAVHFWSL